MSSIDATAQVRMDLWQSVLTDLRQEWSALDADERAWVAAAVNEIAMLQQRLQDLVDAADGAAACRDCSGGCCGHGALHLTLANVLAHYAHRLELPIPDFSRGCPWLGDQGCRFAPALRPFNCITFNCEVIDSRLPAAEYAALEGRLRELYTAFDQRYHGSSLRGLLNGAAQRSGAYLARRPA